MFKKLFAIAALIGLTVLAYTVTSRLDADALAMAIGVLFGILAGIPTALLMVAAGRHNGPSDSTYWKERALAAEARNQRIQTRLAGLIDGQGTIVKTMSQDILQ